MRMQGRLALHPESVVMPLLAPDVPVVTWWHGAPPDRIETDPLGVLAERRITDVTQVADPIAALRQRAEDYAPGDTDLAWTRLTGWRSLLAGAFDTGPVVGATSAVVVGRAGDAGAALLCGWLTARLGVPVEFQAEKQGPSIASVAFGLADGGALSLTDRGDNCGLLRRSGVEDRILPLIGHKLGDYLAEELRRLDPDQPYAAALSAATGLTGLADRAPTRTHVWRDPALVAA